MRCGSPRNVDAALPQVAIRLVDVVDVEIQRRARALKFLLAGHLDHQSDAPALEEREARRRLEEELQAEPVAVELDAPCQILDRHGDLPDRRKRCRRHAGHLSL